MNCPMCARLKCELIEASVHFAEAESEVRSGSASNVLLKFDVEPMKRTLARERRDRAHTAYAEHLATHSKAQTAEAPSSTTVY